MTTEQAIILAFLAAAFLAGWLAHTAVDGRRSRPSRMSLAAVELEPRAQPPVSARERERPWPAQARQIDADPDDTRRHLADAIRAYHAAVVRLRGNGRSGVRSDASTLEQLAGAIASLARAVDYAVPQLGARDPLAERLRKLGPELQQLADDMMRHSRAPELPAPVFDELEQHLISAAAMILGPGARPPRLAASP